MRAHVEIEIKFEDVSENNITLEGLKSLVLNSIINSESAYFEDGDTKIIVKYIVLNKIKIKEWK
jgi:hypothetical protein